MNSFLLFVVPWMNISVHCRLEIRLPKDALDCLHICPNIVQQRSDGVPEYMCCGPMKVNDTMNANHHIAE